VVGAGGGRKLGGVSEARVSGKRTVSTRGALSGFQSYELLNSWVAFATRWIRPLELGFSFLVVFFSRRKLPLGVFGFPGGLRGGALLRPILYNLIGYWNGWFDTLNVLSQTSNGDSQFSIEPKTDYNEHSSLVEYSRRPSHFSTRRGGTHNKAH